MEAEVMPKSPQIGPWIVCAIIRVGHGGGAAGGNHETVAASRHSADCHNAMLTSRPIASAAGLAEGPGAMAGRHFGYSTRLAIAEWNVQKQERGLSTKPGCVPSTLKWHSLTAERQFLASSTVWRFRRGVRLYCPTTTTSSTGDSPVSSAQEKVKFTFECLRRNEYWLYETFLTTKEPECCDVRGEERADSPSEGAVGRGGSCRRTSPTVSSATRLGSRLRLCVLVLILLHTVLTASAAHNTTALSLGGINTLDEGSAREE
ncbi:hypothetical protein MUG91_G15n106 [Manis pentadactyla]|nr:hypothetical protein MUG91_G15n106 [Manis pentadactyla]